MRARQARRVATAAACAVTCLLAVGAPAGAAVAGPRTATAPTTYTGTRVAGHRGLGALRSGQAVVAGAPEESLPALRAAAQHGYVVELDLRFTSDHVPVAVHDATTTRTMTCAGRDIARTTYAALVAQCDLLGMAGLAERDIATWDQVLTAVEPYAGTVVVEIETLPTVQEAGAVVTAIARHAMASRVVVNSFTGSHVTAVTGYAAAHGVRGLRTGLITWGAPSAATVRSAVGAAALMVAPRATAVTEAWVRQMHAAGLQVWVWRPDTAQDWQRLKAMRVDVVITDYPAAATATLPWPVPAVRVTAGPTLSGGLVYHLPALPPGATRWRIWNGSSVRETSASTYTWAGGAPGPRRWAVAARNGAYVGAYRGGTLTLSGTPAAPSRLTDRYAAGHRLRLSWTAPASTTAHPRRYFQVAYGGRTYTTSRTWLDLPWQRPRYGWIGGFAVRAVGPYGSSAWARLAARPS